MRKTNLRRKRALTIANQILAILDKEERIFAISVLELTKSMFYIIDDDWHVKLLKKPYIYKSSKGISVWKEAK